MTNEELTRLRLDCMAANERTKKKIEQKKARLERQQAIVFILMLCLTTVYVGR